MIEVKSLTKRFGSKLALDDISFTVAGGEVLGFLGPNGAGKSTTMNIITGYLSSTSGTVTVGGHEILSEPNQVKRKIGYLPEQPPLYLDMTVREYLSFMYSLKKIKTGSKREHIEEICARVGITDVYRRILRNLSKGYRQRVGLAQAMLGNPDVLILDEPTVGLDPKQIIEIRKLIKQLGKTHTVILSSHILSEVQATCDRVIVIADGKLVADDAPERLGGHIGSVRHLIARIEGPQDRVQSLLEGLPGVSGVAADTCPEDGCFDYHVDVAKGNDVRRELFRRLADRGWPLLGLQDNPVSLEDVFLQLTDPDSAPENETHKPKRSRRKQREREKEKEETS